VKRTSARLGVNLFVNARTDAYLRDLVPAERRLEETLQRAARYRAAGADGIFVPGVVDAPTITALVAGVNLPLNLLARAGLPAAPALAALGVRRLSAGSGIASAVYGRTAALAADFLRHGNSAALADGAMPYAAINALLGPR
jgi:2-methylisocitrate lyase-like PEP mutase family enzyme